MDMKTTTKMSRAELIVALNAQADFIHEQDGRIANLKETVETLNRMLVERAELAGKAEGFAAAVIELLGGEKGLYRALARALHPDRGGDTSQMQALNEAWSKVS